MSETPEVPEVATHANGHPVDVEGSEHLKPEEFRDGMDGKPVCPECGEPGFRWVRSILKSHTDIGGLLRALRESNEPMRQDVLNAYKEFDNKDRYPEFVKHFKPTEL